MNPLAPFVMIPFAIACIFGMMKLYEYVARKIGTYNILDFPLHWQFAVGALGVAGGATLWALVRMAFF